jgi:hypothetical protein
MFIEHLQNQNNNQNADVLVSLSRHAKLAENKTLIEPIANQENKSHRGR